MANILIAGCGDIGCRLGKSLAEQSHTVHAIRRDVSQIPEDIMPIQADLFGQLPEFEQTFDYVYYIVAAKSHNDVAYYQAYVLGLKHLIEALSKQATLPKRLFFISSTSVFGQSDGEEVTEASPTEGKTFSSKRLLEAEAVLQNSDIPGTVIRFGGIYGPGRTHLIDLVQQGKAHCMEGVYSNRIHTDDCVGVLQHLMQQDDLAPLYIGVDNEPTQTCEVYEWLAEQLSVSDIEHIEPTENSRAQRSNKRLSNALIRSTGYEFKYPTFREGYQAVLEDL